MEAQLKNSLKVMSEVFKGLDGYRVLGSVLVASINGKPHRELHDIDLLIDERIYFTVIQRLEQAGFKRVTKKAPGFTWDEFEKQDCLTFGVLLQGVFDEHGFTYKSGGWLTLQIDAAYLRPTTYQLLGVEFTGIPLRSVYEGIKAASLNSKRKRDKAIVLAAVGRQLPGGLTINQAFKVMIGGLAIPYLYTMFSVVYNWIGGLRLRMGKPYDPWR